MASHPDDAQHFPLPEGGTFAGVGADAPRSGEPLTTAGAVAGARPRRFGFRGLALVLGGGGTVGVAILSAGTAEFGTLGPLGDQPGRHSTGGGRTGARLTVLGVIGAVLRVALAARASHRTGTVTGAAGHGALQIHFISGNGSCSSFARFTLTILRSEGPPRSFLQDILLHILFTHL